MRPFFCGKREMSRLRNSVKSGAKELANRPMTDFFEKRGFGRLATAVGALFWEKRDWDGRKMRTNVRRERKTALKKKNLTFFDLGC